MNDMHEPLVDFCDQLGLVDSSGNLLVVVAKRHYNLYELHNVPYEGGGKELREWAPSAYYLEPFCTVCNGEGTGKSIMYPILVGEGKPVRIVTQLDDQGPIYKRVEYRHIDIYPSVAAITTHPDNYISDQDYLTTIPGMTESILNGMATPIQDCPKDLQW